MEWISGNVFIRPNKLEKAGDKTEGHSHNFDHTTYVVSGRVRVIARNDKGEQIADRNFGGPDDHGRHFLVKKDVWHEIIALEDKTEYHCIYSHRTPQGEVSQVNTGWQDAYA